MLDSHVNNNSEFREEKEEDHIGGDRDFGQWLLGAAATHQGGGGGEEGTVTGGLAAARRVHAAVIGHAQTFNTPFGKVAALYADWAASGRLLAPLEDYIRGQVAPWYANTHTSTSVTGLQTSCFRAEARQVVAQACNARVHRSDRHSDVVVFTGTGSSGAVRHLVHVLGLTQPLHAGAPISERPVVFVGPYEHHSNLLPWRESVAEVVTIPEDQNGQIDLAALKAALDLYQDRTVKIGSFSAASNVTGVVSCVDAVSEMLHRGGALACWDYGAAGPYLPLDMNPVVIDEDGRINPWVYKDAMFLSPHKFPGGPGTPGLLVGKRNLFKNAVPHTPGGGTVFFVTGEDHRYLSSREEREEGGTPDIMGSIRLGLTFQVREAVGVAAIQQLESSLTQRLHSRLSVNPRIHILGPPALTQGASASSGRIPLISFLVLAPVLPGMTGGRVLHHSFISALLNDLFGIQVRGGCACAGPYSLNLLGISRSDSHAIEAHLLDKMEVLRPGFVRLSLPYFASEAEAEYTLDCIEAVADLGWRLLPEYSFNYKTGEWRHHSRLRSFPERTWLSHLNWPSDDSGGGDTGGGPASQESRQGFFQDHSTRQAGAAHSQPAASCIPQEEDVNAMWRNQFQTGLTRLQKGAITVRGSRTRSLADQPTRLLADQDDAGGAEGVEGKEAEAENLRWFMLPSEAAGLLIKSSGASGGGRGNHQPGSTQAEVADEAGWENLQGAYHPKVYSGLGRGSEHTRSPENVTPNKNETPPPVKVTPFGCTTEKSGMAGSAPASIGEKTAAERNAEKNAERTVEEARDGFRGNANGKPSCVPLGEGMEQEDEEKEEKKVKVGEALAAEMKNVKVEGEIVKRESGEGGSGQGSGSSVERKTSRKHPLRGSNGAMVRENGSSSQEMGNAEDVGVEDVLQNEQGSLDQLPPNNKNNNKNSKPHNSNNNTKPRNSNKPSRGLAVKPPAKLMTIMARAIKEWGMIQPGDRLLLGLSGGKDSLALLHCLLAYQRKAPPSCRFTLACATVDPLTESFQPAPLKDYLQSLNVPFHLLQQPIFEMATSGVMQGDSICAFCARMKRGALYACCRQNNYNVLVLAQHLDDLAESFFMSAMFNGVLRTMKANYTTDDGGLRVIRPLIYARERLMRDFSYAAGLPVIAENCPACFEAPKERQHVKKLLAKEESLSASLFSSLRAAIAPLMDHTLSCVLQAHPGGPTLGSQAAKQNSESSSGGHTELSSLVEKDLSLTKGVTSLAEASEEDLLAELARRQSSRRLRTVAGGGDDEQLEQELEEKQMFCTSEACKLQPKPVNSKKFKFPCAAEDE